MRLKRVKMAGFKSFVDPTNVELPSNFVSIVGPNGCGKSNTIDAVRLVLGESSAKSLRGEQIADMIFNGSTTRKPVGQASVELVFDNTDGQIGGAWAQYAEIAIRRVITRDGNSTFYLNGTRCRRKDVTDLFLGTGLGPRSYAIIEQGMIARLIEAKPEDLRIFLEEAAGISKYKERRRETETRMTNTQENLNRIADLREELSKQYNRLEKQSKTALEARELRSQLDREHNEVLVLNWENYTKDIQKWEEEYQNKETTLYRLNQEQEQLNVAYTDARLGSEAEEVKAQEAQKIYYGIKQEIVRLESEAQYLKAQEADKRQEAKMLSEKTEQLTESIEVETKKIAEEGEALTALVQVIREGEQTCQDARVALKDHEAKRTALMHALNAFLSRSIEPTRVVESNRAKVATLEDQLRQTEVKIQKLQTEQNSLSWEALEGTLKSEALEASKLEAQCNAIQQALNENETEESASHEIIKTQEAEVRNVEAQLHSLTREIATLEGLQRAALGEEREKIDAWVAKQGFSSTNRLLEVLNVEPGYEHAVECVLGDWLTAISADTTANQDIASAGVKLRMVALAEGGNLNSEWNTATLAAYVQPVTPFHPWLNSVYVATDAVDIATMLTRIPAGSSVITKEGVWAGVGWSRYTPYQKNAPETGTLERAQKLKGLRETEAVLTQTLTELQAKLTELRAEALQLKKNRELLQQERFLANKTWGNKQNEINQMRTRVEHLKGRGHQLKSEVYELTNTQEKRQREIVEARRLLGEAVEVLANIEAERIEWQAAETALTAAYRAEQEALYRKEADLQQHLVQQESLKVSQKNRTDNVERMRFELKEAAEQLKAVEALLTTLTEPLVQNATLLKGLLLQSVEAETHANALTHAVQALRHQADEWVTQLKAKQAAIDDVRKVMEKINLQKEACTVRRSNTLEELAARSVEPEVLLLQIDRSQSLDSRRKSLENLQQSFSALGPINESAIEEFTQCQTRKTYLDAQFEDVNLALATLQKAIATIDLETRTLLQDTYERVNAAFSQLFPRLFGGGNAYLELTGSDLLNSGVEVIARPPGKRNNSIQQLSGGEKALTAVALVFGIFQLNPAPFCILDEVDAPLDEANVGRFCDLLREMSSTVQLVLITHNKTTMETADHLLGVTMREAGVSRVVAVDLAKARELAEV